MNYLSALLMIAGILFSSNVDKPNQVDFENLKGVDREFVSFLSSFEKTDLPFEMTKEDIIDLEKKEHKYKRERNNLLSTFVNGGNQNAIKFSRGGPPQIIPLKRFYPNDKTVAVSYISKDRFNNAATTIMIAVFTLKGKLITFKENIMGSKFKQVISANHFISANTYDQLETFRITDYGIIHKVTYKKLWKKDWKKHGIQNNQVIAYELQSQDTLQFSEEGYLVSLNKKNNEEIGNIVLRP